MPLSVCPGQLLAEDSLYIVVVSVLSTMNVGSATKLDGTPMDSDVEYTAGAIRLVQSSRP